MTSVVVLIKFLNRRLPNEQVVNTAAKESVTEIKSINLNVPLINSNSLFYNSEIEIENELISELHLKKAINQSEFFEESSNHQILMNLLKNHDKWVFISITDLQCISISVNIEDYGK